MSDIYGFRIEQKEENEVKVRVRIIHPDEPHHSRSRTWKRKSGFGKCCRIDFALYA
jgi:hypothetical protein